MGNAIDLDAKSMAEGQAPSMSAAMVLSQTELSELDLTEDDLAQVRTIADQIDPSNRTTLAQFGREIGQKSIQYAEKMLSIVRNSDLEDVGKTLTEVVLLTKQSKVGPLSEGRSHIPVIGVLIDKLKMTRAKFEAKFQNTEQQVADLIANIDSTKNRLVDRVSHAEQMFQDVKDEHRLIGLYIAAGKLRLEEMKALASAARARTLTQSEVQDLNDLENAIATLDKRIADHQVLRHSAFLMMPEIRMYQANNAQQVEKFETIQECTIPLWKRQFALTLSLTEQSQAAKLAKDIDDATNEFMIRNAQLLQSNSVSVAKNNQRLVIDFKTIEQVSDILVSTFSEVIKIQREGMEERASQAPRLLALRTTMENRLARKTAIQ